MAKLFLLVSLLAVCSATTLDAQTSAQSTDQEKAWRSIELRWDGWLKDNFEQFAAQHHPEWRRWSFSTPELMSSGDLLTLWKEFKKNEQYVDLELEPLSIRVFNGGRFAMAHYIVRARVRWVGASFKTAAGRMVQPGDETTIPVRWSDFLVREGTRWLYVGGYRDGNCGLWPGYGRPCEQPQNR